MGGRLPLCQSTRLLLHARAPNLCVAVAVYVSVAAGAVAPKHLWVCVVVEGVGGCVSAQVEVADCHVDGL